VQAGTGTDHVRDRVQTADLVEVHLLRSGAVDLPLGTSQPREHVECAVFDRLCQISRLQQTAHVAPSADHRGTRRLHLYLGGGQSVPGHLLGDQQCGLDADCVHGRLDRLQRHPGVQ
jgi:hypothetical protein